MIYRPKFTPPDTFPDAPSVGANVEYEIRGRDLEAVAFRGVGVVIGYNPSPPRSGKWHGLNLPVIADNDYAGMTIGIGNIYPTGTVDEVKGHRLREAYMARYPGALRPFEEM